MLSLIHIVPYVLILLLHLGLLAINASPLILYVHFSVRIAVPLVTRSTLEVVIPEHAVPKLVMKSKNKLAQISEVSLTSFGYSFA
jgi:hypothetical protein